MLRARPEPGFREALRPRDGCHCAGKNRRRFLCHWRPLQPRECAASEGEVLEDACEVECYMHGSRFNLRSGEPLSMPATKAVPTYQVRVSSDDVLISVALELNPVAPDRPVP